MSINFPPEDFPWRIVTLQQPYGWLIQQGHRTDAIARQATDYRGLVLLHVGREIDKARIKANKSVGYPAPRPSDCFTSAVFGLAKVVDCLPWAEDSFKLVLDDVVPCTPFKWQKERPGLSFLTPNQRSALYERFAHRRVNFLRAERIRQRLEALDLAYGQFCKITGLTSQAIARAVYDDSATEGQEALEQIAFALAVSSEWILTGQGTKEKAGQVKTAKEAAIRVGRSLYRFSLTDEAVAEAIGEPAIAVRRLAHFIFASDKERLEKLAAFLKVSNQWLTTGTDSDGGELNEYQKFAKMPLVKTENEAAQRIQERCRALTYTFTGFQAYADLTFEVANLCHTNFSGTECEEALDRIAAVLDVAPEWILTGEGYISAADPHKSQAIAKRLNRCLSFSNHSNEEIATALGISVATVRRLKVRVFESDGQHLEKISEITGTTIEWLKTGIDPTTGDTGGIKVLPRKSAKRLDWWDRTIVKADSKSQNLVWIAPPDQNDDPQECTVDADQNAFKAARETLGLKLSEVASHLGMSALTLLELEDKPSRAPPEIKEKWQAFIDESFRTRNTRGQVATAKLERQI